jgi:hypothetical protein
MRKAAEAKAALEALGKAGGDAAKAQTAEYQKLVDAHKDEISKLTEERTALDSLAAASKDYSDTSIESLKLQKNSIEALAASYKSYHSSVLDGLKEEVSAVDLASESYKRYKDTISSFTVRDETVNKVTATDEAYRNVTSTLEKLDRAVVDEISDEQRLISVRKEEISVLKDETAAVNTTSDAYKRYNEQSLFGGRSDMGTHLADMRKELEYETLLNRQRWLMFTTPQQAYAWRQTEYTQKLLMNRAEWAGYFTADQYLQYLQKQTALYRDFNAELERRAALYKSNTDAALAYYNAIEGTHKSVTQLGEEGSVAGAQALNSALAGVPTSVTTELKADPEQGLADVALWKSVLHSIPEHITTSLIAVGKTPENENVTINAVFNDRASKDDLAALLAQLRSVPAEVTVRVVFDDEKAKADLTALIAQLEALPDSVTVNAVFSAAAAEGDLEIWLRDLGIVPEVLDTTARFTDDQAKAQLEAWIAKLNEVPDYAKTAVQLTGINKAIAEWMAFQARLHANDHVTELVTEELVTAGHAGGGGGPPPDIPVPTPADDDDWAKFIALVQSGQLSMARFIPVVKQADAALAEQAAALAKAAPNPADDAAWTRFVGSVQSGELSMARFIPVVRQAEAVLSTLGSDVDKSAPNPNDDAAWTRLGGAVHGAADEIHQAGDSFDYEAARASNAAKFTSDSAGIQAAAARKLADAFLATGMSADEASAKLAKMGQATTDLGNRQLYTQAALLAAGKAAQTAGTDADDSAKGFNANAAAAMADAAALKQVGSAANDVDWTRFVGSVQSGELSMARFIPVVQQADAALNANGAALESNAAQYEHWFGLQAQGPPTAAQFAKSMVAEALAAQQAGDAVSGASGSYDKLGQSTMSAAEAAKNAAAAALLVKNAQDGATQSVDQGGASVAKTTGLVNLAIAAWGGWTKDLTLFGGAFKSIPFAATISVWAVALHTLIDFFIVLVPAVIAAGTALGAFGVAAEPSVLDLLAHVQGLHTALDALGTGADVLGTDHIGPLSTKMGTLDSTMKPMPVTIRSIQAAMAPTVVTMYGAAIDALTQKTAPIKAFGQTFTSVLGLMQGVAQKTGTFITDTFIKVDQALTSHSGQLSGLIETAVNDLKILGSIGGSILKIGAEFLQAGQMTHVSELLFEGLAYAFSLLAKAMNAMGPQVIAFGIAVFAVVHYGGLLSTALIDLTRYTGTLITQFGGLVAKITGGSNVFGGLASSVGASNAKLIQMGQLTPELENIGTLFAKGDSAALAMAGNLGLTYDQMVKVTSQNSDVQALADAFGLTDKQAAAAAISVAASGKSAEGLAADLGKITPETQAAMSGLGGVEKATASMALVGGANVSQLESGVAKLGGAAKDAEPEAAGLGGTIQKIGGALAGISAGAWLAIAGAVGGAAYEFYQFNKASGAIPAEISAMNTQLNNLNAAQGFSQLQTDMQKLGTQYGVLRQELNQPVNQTGAGGAVSFWGDITSGHFQSAITDLFGSFQQLKAQSGAAYAALVADNDRWDAAIQTVSYSMKKFGVTGDQAFALMDLAGVKVTDSMSVQISKVNALVTGWTNMGVAGYQVSTHMNQVGNSIDAVALASETTNSQITTLTGDFTQFYTMVTGGETKLETFLTGINTVSTNAKAAGASMTGLNANSLTLRQSWEQNATAAQGLYSQLQLQNAAAGNTAASYGSLQHAGQDMVNVLLAQGDGSKEATNAAYALAQQMGYTGADTYAALVKWSGGNQQASKTTADLNKQVGYLETSSSNLQQDTINLAAAVNTDLNQAIGAALVNMPGMTKAVANFETTIHSAQDQLKQGIISPQDITGANAIANALIAVYGTTPTGMAQAKAEFLTTLSAMGVARQTALTLWSDNVVAANKQVIKPQVDWAGIDELAAHTGVSIQKITAINKLRIAPTTSVTAIDAMLAKIGLLPPQVAAINQLIMHVPVSTTAIDAYLNTLKLTPKQISAVNALVIKPGANLTDINKLLSQLHLTPAAISKIDAMVIAPPVGAQAFDNYYVKLGLTPAQITAINKFTIGPKTDFHVYDAWLSSLGISQKNIAAINKLIIGPGTNFTAWNTFFKQIGLTPAQIQAVDKLQLTPKTDLTQLDKMLSDLKLTPTEIGKINAQVINPNMTPFQNDLNTVLHDLGLPQGIIDKINQMQIKPGANLQSVNKLLSNLGLTTAQIKIIDGLVVGASTVTFQDNLQKTYDKLNLNKQQIDFLNSLNISPKTDLTQLDTLLHSLGFSNQAIATINKTIITPQANTNPLTQAFSKAGAQAAANFAASFNTLFGSIPAGAGSSLPGLPGGGPPPPVKKAAGGHVPGQGQGDTVPAMLTPGEFVLQKPAADALKAQHGPGVLDQLNQAHKGTTAQLTPAQMAAQQAKKQGPQPAAAGTVKGGVQHFAGGGLVGEFQTALGQIANLWKVAATLMGVEFNTAFGGVLKADVAADSTILAGMWTKAGTSLNADLTTPVKNLLTGQLPGWVKAAQASVAALWTASGSALTKNVADPAKTFFASQLPGWAKTAQSSVTAAWAGSQSAFAKDVSAPAQTFFTSSLKGWAGTAGTEVSTAWSGSQAAFTKDVVTPAQTFFTSSLKGWTGSAGTEVSAAWSSSQGAFTKDVVTPVQTFFTSSLKSWSSSASSEMTTMWSGSQSAFAKDVVTPAQTFFTSSLKGWTGSAASEMSTLWSGAQSSFNKDVVTPVQTFFTSSLKGWSGSATTEMNTLWSGSGTSFAKDVATPVQTFFTSSLKGWAGSATTEMSTLWTGAGTSFAKDVVTPVQTFFTSTLAGYLSKAGALWSSTWSTAASTFQKAVETPLGLFFTVTMSGYLNKAVSLWNTSWSNAAGDFQKAVITPLGLFFTVTIAGYFSKTAALWTSTWSNAAADFQKAVETPLGLFFTVTMNSYLTKMVSTWGTAWASAMLVFVGQVETPMNTYFNSTLPAAVTKAGTAITTALGNAAQGAETAITNDIDTGIKNASGNVTVTVKASGGPIGASRQAQHGSVAGAGEHDSVHAMLMPGEFVVRKSARMALEQQYGPGYLHRLNQADSWLGAGSRGIAASQQWAGGGAVGGDGSSMMVPLMVPGLASGGAAFAVNLNLNTAALTAAISAAQAAKAAAAAAAAGGATGSDLANAKEGYSYLLANLFGGHKVAAAGAVASIDGESGWNPAASGSGGRGLIGWTPPSAISDADFSGGMKTQLPAIIAFVNSSGDQATITTMEGETSLNSAAQDWDTGVERAGVNDVHPAGLAMAASIAGIPNNAAGGLIIPGLASGGIASTVPAPATKQPPPPPVTPPPVNPKPSPPGTTAPKPGYATPAGAPRTSPGPVTVTNKGYAVTWKFPPVGGATAYWLTVTAGPTDGLWQGFVSSPVTLAFDGHKIVSWQLQALNGRGWGPPSAVHAYTLTGVTGSSSAGREPQTFPGHVAVSNAGDQVTWKWPPVSGATDYMLAVDDVHGGKIWQGHVHSPTTLGIYGDRTAVDWQMQAGNAGGWGPVSPLTKYAFGSSSGGGGTPAPAGPVGTTYPVTVAPQNLTPEVILGGPGTPVSPGDGGLGFAGGGLVTPTLRDVAGRFSIVVPGTNGYMPVALPDAFGRGMDRSTRKAEPSRSLSEAGAAQSRVGVNVTGDVNIINPVPEKPSDSITRASNKLAYLSGRG